MEPDPSMNQKLKLPVPHNALTMRQKVGPTIGAQSQIPSMLFEKVTWDG